MLDEVLLNNPEFHDLREIYPERAIKQQFRVIRVEAFGPLPPTGYDRQHGVTLSELWLTKEANVKMEIWRAGNFQKHPFQ